jgi:predicted hotdog family 3-hydroxylacyl-ACP dehydratase
MSLHANIIDLIPQRDPIVMIDALLSASEKGCTGRFTIRPDNLLVEDGALSEAGLVENIAQTAAARIGWLCRLENKPVPLGFIGAVQNLEIYGLPKINEEIETGISIKNQIFDVTVIEGEVRTGERLLARCDMKIFISNQP